MRRQYFCTVTRMNMSHIMREYNISAPYVKSLCHTREEITVFWGTFQNQCLIHQLRVQHFSTFSRIYITQNIFDPDPDAMCQTPSEDTLFLNHMLNQWVAHKMREQYFFTICSINISQNKFKHSISDFYLNSICHSPDDSTVFLHTFENEPITLQVRVQYFCTICKG